MSNGVEVAALLAQTEWTRALARSLAGDAHLAEDLVQETWVAALERPPQVDRPVRGWLAAVLRHRVGDLGRERGSREQRERLAARAEALPSAHELVERAALQRTLVEAVLELDEPFRSTVLLRFFEGLPPRQIARRSGTSVATVQSRLTRALERLRERLGRGGGRTAWLSALAPLLREPLVAPLATLGISVMKTVSVLVVLSALLGWFLWRSGEEPASAAVASAKQAEALDAPPGSSSGSGAPSTRASAAGARAPRERAEHEPAPRVDATVTAPAAAPRRARGRVLDTSGNGLAHIELALGARDGVVNASGARCTSGPGGWFELDLERAAERIVVADPAWATVLAGIVRALGETRPLVVVAPRNELAGLVVDEAGAPVAAAELVFELPPGFGDEWGLALDHALVLGWRARSDAEGRFALASVPFVPGATLGASLGGFVAQRELAPAASTRSHVVVLRRPPPEARLIQGVVVDAAGRPVAGARVAARAQSTFTRDDGSFALDLGQRGLRPPLIAVRSGYLPAVFEPELEADGTPRWPPSVVLRLGGSPTTLTGRVLDFEGQPVAGARVWIDDPTPFGDLGRDRLAAETLARGDERFWSYEESAADGSFAIAGLLPRAYRVKAMDPDNLLEVTELHVRPGETPLELVLPTNRLHERVAGQVLDGRGAPVAGALVRLFRTTFRMALAEGQQSDAAMAQAQLTGADGRFEFHGVPEDVALLVTGETILYAWGELASAADVESLEIVARLRLQLQVELEQPHGRADAFQVLDSAGQELVLNVMQGDGPFHAPRMALVDGRSAVVSLDEDAALLVLLLGEEIVARVPLNLAPDVVNLVRY